MPKRHLFDALTYIALRSSVGKRLVGVIHEFIIDPIAPHATTLSRYGASGSRSLATVHDT